MVQKQFKKHLRFNYLYKGKISPKRFRDRRLRTLYPNSNQDYYQHFITNIEIKYMKFTLICLRRSQTVAREMVEGGKTRVL